MLKLLLLKIFILFINYCYCQINSNYDYSVTVYFGTNNFISSKGDIYITFFGSNGLYNHTEKLNVEFEIFKPGQIKQYKSIAPWSIDYIENLYVKFESFDNSFIYIDRIIVDPAYLGQTLSRQTSIKPYCPSIRPDKVGINEVNFWVRC
jgi:hypothetical protein